MLKILPPTEVLPVRIFHPASHHRLVAQVMLISGAPAITSRKAGRISESWSAFMCGFLANVKDEPRLRLARLVRKHEA
jgi:hypothetical protein